MFAMFHRRRDRARLGDAPLPAVIALWLPVVAWMAAIYYGAALSSVPGPAAAVSDTVLHMAGYAGLALLTLRATAARQLVRRHARRPGAGARDRHGARPDGRVEQMFVPTRFAEWRDVGNDVIGALLGLLPAWAWGKIRTE